MPRTHGLRPLTPEERLRRLLDAVAHRKASPQWQRAEARELLRMLEEGGLGEHYTTPRPGWEPDTAFEGHDRERLTRGNIEPEEGALKRNPGDYPAV